MLESDAKYNRMYFCPTSSPFSSKPDDTDVALSVCLQLIHYHGTGDLLDERHPCFLYPTTASSQFACWLVMGAVSRPIVQTD